MAAILTFIVLNIVFLINSYLLFAISNKDKGNSFSKTTISVFTFFFSHIIISEIILGTFGILNYQNLAITAFLILLLLLSIYIFKKPSLPQISKPKNITLALITFAPLLFLLINRLAKILSQIPMEYDSVAYHLPFATKWLQTESIIEPYYTAFSGPIGYYPGNFDLLTLFSFLPLNNDLLATIINFLLYIPLSFGLYAVFRNFKIGKKLTLLLTAALLYMPIFIDQTGTQLADLFFTTTFVSSIYFLQENHKKYSDLNTLLFALSLGLFMGTKYLAIPYAIIPLIIFLVLHHKPKQILILLFGLLLTGSFFYFRNLFSALNPVFPAEITLLGTTIFEGVDSATKDLANSSILQNIFHLQTMKSLLIGLYLTVGYSGLLLIGLVGTKFILLTFKKWRKKLLSENFKLLWLSVAVCAIYFFIYLSSPHTSVHIQQNIRYAMPFFVTATISSGLLISQLKKGKYLFYIALLFTIAHSIFNLNFHNLLNTNQLKLADRENSLTTTAQIWHRDNYKIYGLTNIIDWLDKKAPATKIAYTGFNFHYHLYGRNLQREVDYININNCQNCDYFDYKNTPDGIRSNPNYDYWLKNLKAKNKEFVVIDGEPESEVKMHELNWAFAHPKTFKIKKQERGMYLFEVM